MCTVFQRECDDGVEMPSVFGISHDLLPQAGESRSDLELFNGRAAPNLTINIASESGNFSRKAWDAAGKGISGFAAVPRLQPEAGAMTFFTP
jgi:hypothetical protein